MHSLNPMFIPIIPTFFLLFQFFPFCSIILYKNPLPPHNYNYKISSKSKNMHYLNEIPFGELLFLLSLSLFDI